MLTQAQCDRVHEAVKNLMDQLVLTEGIPFLVVASTICTAAASVMSTMDRVFEKKAGDDLMKLIVDKRREGNAITDQELRKAMQ